MGDRGTSIWKRNENKWGGSISGEKGAKEERKNSKERIFTVLQHKLINQHIPQRPVGKFSRQPGEK